MQPREIRWRVVDVTLFQLTGLQIEAPFVHATELGVFLRQHDVVRMAAVLTGVSRGRGDRRGFGPTSEQHDLVTLLPRVERVEHVARWPFEPADVAVVTVTRNDAVPRRQVAIEEERKFSLHDAHRLEHQRQIQKDRVAPGDGEVVHHDPARDLDRHDPNRLAISGHHAVVEMLGAHRVVSEEHHFARLRIDFGMRRKRAGQPTVPRSGSHGLEVGQRDLVRLARLPKGEQPAVVVNERRVRHVLAQQTVGRIVELRHLTKSAPQLATRVALVAKADRAHPAVAIRRLAAFEQDSVQHSVAVEPVVLVSRIELRIGTGPQEHAVERLGELPDYIETVGEDLVVDGCKVA